MSDLRQQLTGALAEAAHTCDEECGGRCAFDDHPIWGIARVNGSVTQVLAAPEAIAEVCATTMQGELGARDADIEDLHDLIASEREMHEATIQRAEAAEARLRALLDQHPFQQRAGVSVLVCTCGKWPAHHVHIGESTQTCGCDECRTIHQQIGDQP